ncbi:hypothetical protein HOD20_06970 [archaeon]|nr:hypothetical protein [archaeon]MBT4647161.1 hypothetical protein [archaeon]MBT6822164.1 hypothetical protein [archaeon]MBT7391761.1 hypothetical protein [archaeon]
METFTIILIAAFLLAIFIIIKIVKKLAVKIIFITLAILGLIFLLSFVNIAFFDFQCIDSKNICSSSILRANGEKVTSVYFYSQCQQDCSVRNYRCGYDIDYYSECNDCIGNCQSDQECMSNC